MQSGDTASGPSRREDVMARDGSAIKTILFLLLVHEWVSPMHYGF
jgi:hypothetical protein